MVGIKDSESPPRPRLASTASNSNGMAINQNIMDRTPLVNLNGVVVPPELGSLLDKIKSFQKRQSRPGSTSGHSGESVVVDRLNKIIVKQEPVDINDDRKGDFAQYDMDTGLECSSTVSTISNKSVRAPVTEIPFELEWLKLRPANAQFPEISPFPVRLEGYDEMGYVYVQLHTAERNWEVHFNLTQKIKTFYSQTQNKKDLVVPFHLIEEGHFVIVRTIPKAKGFTEKYIRAEVVSKNEADQTVVIFDVDSIPLEETVSSRNVFCPTELTVKLPAQVIKCELEELSIFSELQVVQQIVRRLNIGTETILNAIVLWTVPVPKLRLLLSTGENLLNKIRQQIPFVCQVPIYERDVEMLVKITHVSNDGYIWYQMAENELMEKILYFTDGFDPKELMAADPKFQKDVRKNLEDPDMVFAAPFDDVYYRAKVIELVDHNQVLVSYIDFGNTSVVAVDEMFMIEYVDINFHYIPAQARKVKLHNIGSVNPDTVWGFLASTNDDPDVLVMKTEAAGAAEVDILVKLEDGNELTSLVEILLQIEEEEDVEKAAQAALDDEVEKAALASLEEEVEIAIQASLKLEEVRAPLKCPFCTKQLPAEYTLEH